MTARSETKTSREDLKISTLNTNSRKHAKTVLHTTTRVLFLRREKKTSIVLTSINVDPRFNNATTRTDKTSTAITARKMVTIFKNVISRRGTINNVCTVIRRIVKKRPL